MKQLGPGRYTETYRDVTITLTRIEDGRDHGWWNYSLPGVDETAFGPWRTRSKALDDARRSIDVILARASAPSGA